MSLQLLEKQITKPDYPHIVDVSTDPESKETFVKMFLLDDTINKNFWHVPTSVMKKYATSFIGRPWIIHPSGDHPQYVKEGVAHNSPTLIEDILHVQDRYKGGDIIDVTYEPLKENPNKKAFFTTIRVTNSKILERIRSGALSPYVSPQIYDLSKAEAGEPTTEFIPLHVATVNDPAYGNVARIRGICNGSGPTCINALKSAAVQLVEMINRGVDNSSFLKNSDNNTNRTLTNQTYFNPEQQVIAENGYNPQPQQTVDQNGQLISQRTQVQEVDANGNLITRTEDKKPRTQNKNPSQIIATPQSTQGQAPQAQAQQPQATQVPQNPEIQQPGSFPQSNQNVTLPNEILEAFKGFQATIQGMQDRLNNIENFKKSAEDEKVKAASEAQRKIIESVFTPEIIQDENARQDIVNKFVALPLSDEDLAWILDLVVTGKFSVPDDGSPPKQAPPKKEAGTKRGTVKQASLNLSRLVMQNPVDQYSPNALTAARRFFGDVNVDNL